MSSTHSNIINLKDTPYFNEKYDPSWLVEASLQVAAEYPWLPQALSTCTHIKKETEFYIYFLSPPENPNKPGSEWQYQEGITLVNTREGGEVILDIVQGNLVGGVEFSSKLFAI